MKRKSLFRRILKWTFRSIVFIFLVFIGWSLIPLNETIKPIQPRHDTKYWTMQNGYKIAYTKLEGDTTNTNPPIIFIHGGPGGYIHSATIELMKAIAEAGYTVYLYDQIGSGFSDRLPKPKDYSFDRHLTDLKKIISEEIKSQKVILIGHSYGGILATHFTASNSSKIERLILSSPGDLQPYRINADSSMADMQKLYPIPEKCKFKQPIEVFEETERQQLQPRIIMSMFCALAFNFKWASDKEFDDYTNMMASKFTKGMVANPENVKPEEGLAGGYSHGFSNFYGDLSDIRETMKKLYIPTLVIQGQYDQGTYADVFEYADLMNGRYEFIEDAGHIIWWDKPTEYQHVILKFLETKTTTNH